MAKKKLKALKTFETTLDIEIETNRGGDRISRVRFKFPSGVWADLANKEGDLLPACCANISAIRDDFMAAMREDGWMDSRQVEHLVVNMSGHKFDEDHPVAKVHQVWESLRPRMDLSKPHASDPSDVRHAVTSVWFSDIWNFCAEYGHDSMFSGFGDRPHDQAKHNRMLFEILPTIKVLYEKIIDTKFPPVEGYCLMRHATGQPYELSHRGYAIFEKYEEALKIRDNWVATHQVQVGDADILPCRVSAEKGFEVTTEITNPWKAPERDGGLAREHLSEFFFKINEIRTWNEENCKSDKADDILLKALKEIQAIGKRDDPEED